jgi:hypothetical protein
VCFVSKLSDDGRKRRPVLDGRALVFGRALGKGKSDYDYYYTSRGGIFDDVRELFRIIIIFRYVSLSSGKH